MGSVTQQVPVMEDQLERIVEDVRNLFPLLTCNEERRTVRQQLRILEVFALWSKGTKRSKEV